MMKEGPRFIGRRYSESDRAETGTVLRKWSEESSRPLDGELDKTDEEMRMIQIVNDLLQKELESLGITNFEPIAAERIHILTHDVYEKYFPGSMAHAIYSSVSNMPALDTGVGHSDTKARLFTGILHEAIHGAQAKRFYKNENNQVMDARVGYRIRSAWKEPIERQALTGFNEIMVESTIYKIVRENSEKLEQELGINSEDLQGEIYSYMGYAPLLHTLIRGLAHHEQIPESEVFRNLERGQFQRTILSLKSIERVFGEGALEILSYLGVLNNPAARMEVDELVRKYFETEDADLRYAQMMNLRGVFGRYRMQEAADTEGTSRG